MEQKEAILVKVLFICTGNICRSPTAEGVFRRLVQTNNLRDKIEIDSVGTGSWHIGHPPDERSQKAASQRGYNISDQRSRLINKKDISDSDYLLAMDTDNIQTLKRMITKDKQNKPMCFLEFAPHLKQLNVPDPYYSGLNGFELVLDLIEEASKGLLIHIRKNNI
jgi:protein-tyrosine phosphatase